jgi:ubiquinone biosynthesis protein Coq4
MEANKMNKTQRLAQQRVIIHQAFGLMDSAKELFGIEDDANFNEELMELRKFHEKLNSFRVWVWEEGPLA